MPKAPSPAAGRKRHGYAKAYRLTCGNCRTRKVKCDGDQPQCRICQAYGDSCRYDKPPPMSQVLAMAEKIEHLERKLAVLQQDGMGAMTELRATNDKDTSPTSVGGAGPLSRSILDMASVTETNDSPSYQSTSAVQEPVSMHLAADLEVPSTTVTTMYSVNGEQLQYWEEAACQSCAAILHLPIETVHHLLKTHFTWVYPTFLFVARPRFLRDAASGGPHFSPLLLLVMCFHATRFTNHGLKDEFLARVRLTLGQQLHADPSVPTVQALLHLSAREIGHGALSRAWLYSGMAFRMAVDMAIFSKSQPNYNIETRGIREQLAWSCYLWDKAMSLYLGRAPVLLDPPACDPPRLDEAAETDLWRPHFETTSRQNTFIPSPSYALTCFANLCKLGPIVNDVLLTMYAKKIPDQPLPFVQEIAQRLDSWRANSRPYLIIHEHTQICPPPNILTQNLLYHATIILLNRPLDKSATCRSICRNAAQAVEHILLLYEKALGFSHITYMMAYCAYVAATTAILDMHDGLSGAQAKVNTYLRALYGARSSCPAIQRSIDIIVKSYDKSSSTKPTTTSQIMEKPTAFTQPEPLPAFPYDDGQQYGFLGGDPGWDFTAGGLDPFATEWSRIPMDSFEGFPLFAPAPDIIS